MGFFKCFIQTNHRLDLLRSKTICYKNFWKFALNPTFGYMVRQTKARVPVNLWLNGKRGEWWYHSFDYLKCKRYEGSLLEK